MSYTIVAIVENKPGVLARTAGLFSRRGFNIESLVVGATENPNYSRMTISVKADEVVLEQVMKQLNKLINVIKVSRLDPEDTVERELAIIKVDTKKETRSEIVQIVDVFRARTVDIAEGELIIEVTGNRDKIDAVMKLLENYGIREMSRTGEVILARGLQPT